MLPDGTTCENYLVKENIYQVNIPGKKIKLSGNKFYHHQVMKFTYLTALPGVVTMLPVYE